MHTRRTLTVGTGGPTDALVRLADAVGTWAEDHAADQVGASVVQGAGYWDGRSEPCATVTFDWPSDDDDRADALWAELVDLIADALPLERFGHYTRQAVHFEEYNLSAIRTYNRVVEPKQGRRWVEPEAKFTPAFARPWGPNR